MASDNEAKLIIRAFEDAKFEKKTGDSFSVMFNPNGYTQKFTIAYEDQQASGTSGSPKNFDKIKPGDLQLEFIIDGTGTVGPIEVSKSSAESTAAKDGEAVDVNAKIKEFKKVCMDINPQTHRPPFVQVVWGTLNFEGILTSVDIKYTLFNKEGKPLRATLSTTFSTAIADEPRVKEEGKRSPDLTHKRVVQEGDTLPLMTYRIYGDSKYYLQIAQVNGLKDFRNLQPGQEIYFPPIAKTTSQG